MVYPNDKKVREAMDEEELIQLMFEIEYYYQSKIRDALEKLNALCNNGPIEWKDIYEAVKILEHK